MLGTGGCAGGTSAAQAIARLQAGELVLQVSETSSAFRGRRLPLEPVAISSEGFSRRTSDYIRLRLADKHFVQVIVPDTHFAVLIPPVEGIPLIRDIRNEELWSLENLPRATTPYKRWVIVPKSHRIEAFFGNEAYGSTWSLDFSDPVHGLRVHHSHWTGF